MWTGSIKKLQKCAHGHADVLQLMEYLLDQLDLDEMELFLVQAWLIWNQRSTVVHGGCYHDPVGLNKRAVALMEEYRQSQVHFRTAPATQAAGVVLQSDGLAWEPPPSSVFKLNFDVAIFKELDRSGFRAVVRNDKGEAMAAMSAISPAVRSSDEAELLACRKAIEFARDAGFLELVIEGDNVNAITAISTNVANQ